MNLHKTYDFDYYERGEETGKSCYTNYRWMPEQTLDMCRAIIKYCNIQQDCKILDFGCAKGFIVKAFRILGYESFGCDISEYAISNCDPEVKDYVSLYKDSEALKFCDLIISKDVFEHIPYSLIQPLLAKLAGACNYMFVVVPLGKDNKYIAPEYELDVTHIIREDMSWWRSTLEIGGFEVVKSSYLAPGIKDNWAHYEKANAFFLLKAKKPEND